MKSFFQTFAILLVSALAISVSAQPLWKNPLVKRIRKTDPDYLRVLRGLRQKVRDNGCDVNLCFALQGDEFITPQEFQDQKDFVDLMVAILTTDRTGNYCAVQYGRTTTPISPLTGDKLAFLDVVQKVDKVGGTYTNIAGALGYAGFQLRARIEDTNKLVILGDGLDSVGFAPKRIAKKVRQDGTDICAVAVGGYSVAGLKDIVGGDLGKIVTVDGFFDLGEIIVELVNGVCGFDPTV